MPDSGPDEFLSAIRRSPELWDTIDVRVLGARVDGSWHNLLTRVYLDPRPMNEVPRLEMLPIASSVGCWQGVRSAADVGGLLEQVGAGALRVGDVTISYRAIAANPPDNLYSFGGYLFQDLFTGHQSSYHQWSHHFLGAYGNAIADVARRVPGNRFTLDNALRAGPEPFDGLAGAAQYALGVPNGLGPNDHCAFEIVAPLPARFDASCRWERAELVYRVIAGATAIRPACSVGMFILNQDGSPLRCLDTVQECDWQRVGDSYTAERRMKVPIGSSSATLFLRVNDLVVDRSHVWNPAAIAQNHRIGAFSVLDRAFPRLAEILRDPVKDASGFEKAVATLLGLLGFQVTALSGFESEAMDILAFSPHGPVCLAVECTLSAVGSQGKLGKLIARCGQIRDAVPVLGVRPAVVTALGKSNLSESELDQAGSDEIAVVDQDSLKELLQMATQGAQARETLAFFKSRIPQRTNRRALRM